MKLLPSKNQSGFTLIELLVVIGILAVLLSIVLIAINPARQFAQANNTQRRSDVSAILNGIHQFAADNRGNLPPGMPLPGNSSFINSTDTTNTFCEALVPTYIAALPKDPTAGIFNDCNSYDTNYKITVATSSGTNTPRITVSAPDTELGISVISVTR